ncbi:transcriptional regulator family: Fungal Specific TF [Trichoderma aggressivum f. europaeum]|uniref:Transcriptional regulator family: Fungal Specific TF n=1 Tax=Trichoderma aggressivum f. europaeum TaxID=173218 RepID=A0AAE1IGF1_9HYPO|nr:transcriptional regulator family: Fungal Specific TF [Trichoderma aggressivum f. europaeum]
MSSPPEHKPNSHNFQSTDDVSSLEMLHRLTGIGGGPMVAVKPTLSMSLALSPFTLTTLTATSIPFSHSCFVSEQGSRGLHFQVFEAERFEFLLNFTLCGGLDISFNFLTSSEKGISTAYFDTFLTIDDLLSIDYEAGGKWVKESEERSRVTKTMEWLFDPLLPQTKEICEKLLNLPGIDELVTGNHVQSLDEQCLEFFNPLNLRRLLNTYWKRWHRNCPVIHPPSFDPSQAPAELVLVLALIGACVSKYPNDVQNARKWLEPVEKLVFSLPWLSRETQGSRADPTLTRYAKLRILQTVILMCALQTWEGSEKSKERIRKFRFPFVAQASQELAYHQPDEQIGSDLAATLRHWDEFILEEQILR